MGVDGVAIAVVGAVFIGQGMVGACGERRERDRGADEGFFGHDGFEHSSRCAYVLEGREFDVEVVGVCEQAVRGKLCIRKQNIHEIHRRKV